MLNRSWIDVDDVLKLFAHPIRQQRSTERGQTLKPFARGLKPLGSLSTRVFETRTATGSEIRLKNARA